jgi:hypothetical protein
MEKDLYLVTFPGDRHEDHVPIGVYDFDGLNKLAAVIAFDNGCGVGGGWVRLTEEELKSWDDNTWYDLSFIDCDEQYVDEFFTTQNKDDSFDDCINPVSIIRINVNKEMPTT